MLENADDRVVLLGILKERLVGVLAQRNEDLQVTGQGVVDLVHRTVDSVGGGLDGINGSLEIIQFPVGRIKILLDLFDSIIDLVNRRHLALLS